MFLLNIFFVLFLSFLSPQIKADTPAKCYMKDLRGTWNIYLYSNGHNSSLSCKNPGKYKKTITFTFSGINTVVMKKTGAEGTFNINYNEGFDVDINNQKFFTFFAWEKKGKHSRYWCDRTMTGWVHDSLGNDWGCFKAVKKKTWRDFMRRRFSGEAAVNNPFDDESLDEPFDYDDSVIEDINSRQNSWIAGDYPELKQMTVKQVLTRAGLNHKPVMPANLKPNTDHEYEEDYSDLPESFDWRDVNGQNFVSPVRNQGNCGSCYIEASLGMLEARVRVMTNNTQKPVFSVQDVVSCSEYSQGCQGGFPYLIAGKYAQDFGVVEESCYPYLGHNTKTCSPIKSCKRTYVADYEYVGGYYGGGNEKNMMRALVKYGPIATSFECPIDFHLYQRGVYHRLLDSLGSPDDDFDPFERTDHSILIVGYGVDRRTGEKYWIIKNSWGPSWGENGFGKFRRGVDEAAIESMAVQSWPIPHLF